MQNHNYLTVPLTIAFLFFAGALIGWVIEFQFRNLISHNGPRGKYFINPGFCIGPYLPIYGIGLSVMFIISYVVTLDFGTAGTVAVILIIAIMMTLIEFIGGLYLLKVRNIRLWDYRKRPGNIMGIVCPLFSLIWGAIGAVYYLLIHDIAFKWIIWLANNLSFAFFIGLFYGVFAIDLFYSSWKARIIQEYGNKHDVVVKYEELKELMLSYDKQAGKDKLFFRQGASGETLSDALERLGEKVADEKAIATKRIKKTIEAAGEKFSGKDK